MSLSAVVKNKIPRKSMSYEKFNVALDVGQVDARDDGHIIQVDDDQVFEARADARQQKRCKSEKRQLRQQVRRFTKGNKELCKLEEVGKESDQFLKLLIVIHNAAFWLQSISTDAWFHQRGYVWLFAKHGPAITERVDSRMPFWSYVFNWWYNNQGCFGTQPIFYLLYGTTTKHTAINWADIGLKTTN